jgi:hypothetical protein
MFLAKKVRLSRAVSQQRLSEKDRKHTLARVLMWCSRRVTAGHNGDDERGNFAGFLPRHQRIGTR